MRSAIILAVMVFVSSVAYANTVNISPYTRISENVVTVATPGTAVPIMGDVGSFLTQKGIICASANDTGVIAIGGSGVTTKGGLILYPSSTDNTCVTLELNDFTKVYADSNVAGTSARALFLY